MAQLHFQQRPITVESPMQGFRVIFVALFCVFLFLAMVGQMFFVNWRAWLPGAEGTQSVFESVRSAAYTVISQIG
ncbi:MAG: hypothetical protein LH632_06110 [Rhodoferax sp.]|nr:hypothetical protein [Rhodoferax sp.]